MVASSKQLVAELAESMRVDIVGLRESGIDIVTPSEYYMQQEGMAMEQLGISESIFNDQHEEGFDPYYCADGAVSEGDGCDGPEETWEDYLAISDYKLLTETVRLRRQQRKTCPFKSEAYKQHGTDLYDLQVALKTRFRIDISKVK